MQKKPSRLSQSFSTGLNRPKMSKYEDRIESSVSRSNNRNKNVDWNSLGEKIEDWFETAKTPGLKKIIHFMQSYF